MNGYIVRTPAAAIPAATIRDAAVLLLRVGKADPGVTFMPYITDADGSRLSDEDQSECDAALDSIDYDDALAPWGA